jgi:hypothetical protein
MPNYYLRKWWRRWEFCLSNISIIQKGILLYACHIVRKFLNIDAEHNKTQQSQNVEARHR